MSPVEAGLYGDSTKDGDTVVQVTTRLGDFVVCNLASSTSAALTSRRMRSCAPSHARRCALDNVIDLNEAPLAYAKLTNAKYRSIGLGVQLPPHAREERHPLGERGAPRIRR